MRIDFPTGATIMTEDCSYCDVYMLIIDEEEKSIDVSDYNGMMIGMIHYDDNVKNVDARIYEKDDNNIESIIINQELANKWRN